MKVIINGAVCDLTEQTAVGILYPDFAWCKTLAQARREQEASKRAEQELWNISDYDVFSDVYKSIHGVRPRWISREEFERRKLA